MKKHLLFFCLAFFGIMANGQIQNSIPNGTFENWSSDNFYYPQNYQFNSNISTYFRQNVFNLTRTTDAYHGTYAVQLATTTILGVDTSFAYYINISPQNSPTAWTGGMAINQKPAGIRGYYKYNVETADSGTIIAAFSKAGINIGTYFIKIGGVKSTYTLFNHVFSPPLAVTPDEVAIGAISCKFSPWMQEPRGFPGSTLILDSLSFTGVATQPASMNGDFEMWQFQTVSFPLNWYPLSAGDQSTGVSLTTDAYEGNSAVQLETYLGSQNGQPAAQGGVISTGYFPRNCQGACTQKGGYPFSNSKDTLVFSYKYSPEGIDNAIVQLTFKKNGAIINGAGAYLDPSATYQVKKVPFDIGTDPDTVIINISSSDWNNTDPSYVGAILKIDKIYFKSQDITTGISQLSPENNLNISIFPNPSKGKFQINSSNVNIQKLEIYDAIGNLVYSNNRLNKQISNEIDLSQHRKGIYFAKFYDGMKIYMKKIIIQ